LNQDIELRLRFSEYFAAVSDPRYKEGWEKFRIGLEKRRNELRREINQKEKDLDKIRTRRTLLDVSEQSELAQLERELRWYYAELGYVRQDTNVSAPIPRSLDEVGKDFNGPLVPVTDGLLSKTFGPPTNSAVSESTTSGPNETRCFPIDGQDLVPNMDDVIPPSGDKIRLIKPAAASLARILSNLRQDDPEMLNNFSFVGGPTCALYDVKAKTFDPSSWGVSVRVNPFPRSGLVSAVWVSLFELSGFTPDPFILVSLEKMARYFRDERWYWRAGDRVKKPGIFIVSASLFDEWVKNGEFKKDKN
jgi:hypothetical protein